MGGLAGWALVVAASSVHVHGQAAANASGNSTPAIVLPTELALEMELQVARDERDQALNRLEALQLQTQQLSNLVDQFIADAQSERIQKGNDARLEVAKQLVKALGGDWEKRDRWDWKQRALVKADGTVVPLKPEEKKP